MRNINKRYGKRQLAIVVTIGLCVAWIGTADELKWDPAGGGTPAGSDGNGAWVSGGGTWYNTTTPGADVWTNGDSATFGNGGGGTVTIDGAGVSAANLTLNSGGYRINGGNLTLSGTASFLSGGGSSYLDASLTGSGSVVKNNGGVLYVRGANSYTGTTTISGGYHVLSNPTALGTTAGGTLVQSGATLQFESGTGTVTGEAVTLNGQGVGGTRGAMGNWSGNSAWTGPITLATDSRIYTRTGTGAGTLRISGPIDGAGGLLKTGGNVLYVSGANTYSGTTTVAGGYHVLSSPTALGSTAGGTVVQSGATLQFETGTGTVSGQAVTLNGQGVSGNRGAMANWSGVNTWTGSVNLASNSRIYTPAGSLDISGPISGTGSLLKTGNALLTLSGGTANNYSGSTTIEDGTVALSKPDNTAAIPHDLTLNNANTPTIWTTADNQFGAGSVVSFVNGGSNARFNLLGTTQTLAGIVSTHGERRAVIQNHEAGFGYVGPPNSGTSSLVLAPADGDAYSFNGYLRNWIGTLGLVKNGLGTQTISGDRINYTGTTTVNLGTLNLVNTNALATSAIIVNGGTLNLDTPGTSVTATTTVNAGMLNLINTTSVNTSIVNNGTVGIAAANGGDSWNLEFNKTLSGSGTWIKTGPGRATLNNTTLTTSGKFEIQEGTLRNNFNASNWSGSTADMDISGGAILDLYADPIYVDELTGSGFVQNNYGNGGGFSGSAQFMERLIVGVDNGSSTFDGIIRDNLNGTTPAIATNGGGIDLIKVGTGTLSLTGDNSYTGETNINAGTLLVNGEHSGGGTYTIAPGARLGGSGIIHANVVNNGIISPGNSPGGLTINGDTTLGTYVWDILDATPGGEGTATGWDLLTINGDLTVNPGDEIRALGLDSLLPLPNGTAGFPDNLDISVAGNTTGPFDILTLNGNLLGGPATLDQIPFNPGNLGQYGFFTSFVNGNTLQMTFHSTVPEPSTWAIFSMLLIGTTFLIRRQNGSKHA